MPLTAVSPTASSAAPVLSKEAEERLSELYQSIDMNHKSSTDVLMEGLSSISAAHYDKITVHAKWLRDVIYLVENLPISVLIASRELTDGVCHPICYVNKAFEKLTQFTRFEIMGLNCKFLQGTSVQSEHESSTSNEMAKLLAKGESMKMLLTNYKKDGTKFRNYLSLFPIKDKNGTIYYYISIQCDVTDESTPANFMMLIDDLISVIPAIIYDADEIVNPYFQNLFATIGTWKTIEQQYKDRPKSSFQRRLPNRRETSFLLDESSSSTNTSNSNIAAAIASITVPSSHDDDGKSDAASATV